MKKVYLFAALAAGMTFASCNNDDNVNLVDNGSALMVENVGLQGLKSRAGITATEFTNGESIGVYIYEGAVGTYGTYNDGAAALPTVNVEYTQGAPWTSTQPIVVSTKMGVVYATYPYNVANTTPGAIAVNVAENQGTGQSDGVKDVNEQTDYMWATPVENVSNKDAKIDLTMNHALAMVSFKFKQSADAGLVYPGVGKVTSIKLFNSTGREIVKTGAATMNIADGVITGATASANGITLSPASETLMDVTDEALLPRLLLYPAAAWTLGDLMLNITVDGNLYELRVPVIANGYQPGNNYCYTLTMKGTQLEITTVSINEWIDVEAGEGDIQTPKA